MWGRGDSVGLYAGIRIMCLPFKGCIFMKFGISMGGFPSGVTPLGSGWANLRAPDLGGHPSEVEDLFFFFFFSLYIIILLIHNYALFGCPPFKPLEHVNSGCPL